MPCFRTGTLKLMNNPTPVPDTDIPHSLNLILVPTLSGTLVYNVTLSAQEVELDLSNNTVSTQTTVTPPGADVPHIYLPVIMK